MKSDELLELEKQTHLLQKMTGEICELAFLIRQHLNKEEQKQK